MQSGHLEACSYLATGTLSDCRCEQEAAHYMKLALVSLGLFLGELAGGLVTGSLALISDSFHVLVDGTENVVSVIVSRMARTNGDEFALRRRGGYASATLLVSVACIVLWEARERMYHPRELYPQGMLAVAGLGFIVNLFQLWLHKRVPNEHKNLTHGWQFAHLLSATLTSVAVIVTGLVVLRTGSTVLDPLVSFGIGGAILIMAARRLVSSRGA